MTEEPKRFTVDDILPCPFCGCAPDAVCDDYINGRIIADPDFFIECANAECGVWPEIKGKDAEFQILVATWNKRARQ